MKKSSVSPVTRLPLDFKKAADKEEKPEGIKREATSPKNTFLCVNGIKINNTRYIKKNAANQLKE